MPNMDTLTNLVIDARKLYLGGLLILTALNLVWMLLRKPLRFFLAANFFAVYLLYLINLTILPVPLSIFTQGGTELSLGAARINLQPFDIGRFGSWRPRLNQLDLLNILAFVPFGFLLPFTAKKGRLPILLYALLATLIIETAQLVLSVRVWNYSRVFDITDIFTNVFGAWLGYLLARLALGLGGKTSDPQPNPTQADTQKLTLR